MGTLNANDAAKLAQRAVIGNRCISLAAGGNPYPDEDLEMHASDAISDILTAIYGPAGTCEYDGSLKYSQEALDKANGLLERSLHSYKGDAEDYARKPV